MHTKPFRFVYMNDLNLSYKLVLLYLYRPPHQSSLFSYLPLLIFIIYIIYCRYYFQTFIYTLSSGLLVVLMFVFIIKKRKKKDFTICSSHFLSVLVLQLICEDSEMVIMRINIC